MEIVEFIQARLAEDEEIARFIADRGHWRGIHVDSVTEVATHINRHDPARVLAEVESKRRLLEQFRLRGDSVRRTVQPATGGVWDDLLRLLALPYADHPAYREDWRP